MVSAADVWGEVCGGFRACGAVSRARGMVPARRLPCGRVEFGLSSCAAASVSGDGGLGPSVGAHLQIVEQQAWGAVQLAHGGGDGFAVHFDHADGKAAQPSHVLGSMAGADAAVVLVPVVAVIEDAMQGVFESSIGLLLFQSKFPAFQISIQHTETRQ